jgi:cation diffusion facilitator family transporter
MMAQSTVHAQPGPSGTAQNESDSAAHDLSRHDMNRPATRHAHERLLPSFARATRAMVLGLVVSTVLAAVKILGGVFGQSYALIADGVESLLDVFGSSIVWGSLHYAARPPDAGHPYGHGKAEPLGAMVIAAALVVASIAIAVESIREIRTPHAVPAPFTLIILVGVVITKEVLFRFLIDTGKDVRSRAVEADAWHHRSDALTSLAAFMGISIALWKGPAYASSDDYAALFACGIIFFNGLRLFRGAVDDLMDAAPPAGVEAAIREIAMTVPGVLGTHNCRVRRSGMGFIVDLDVIVDGDISVRRGHEIAHEVKAKLLASNLGILDVLGHVEPAAEEEP